jgi:hypothetical protein
MTPFDLLLFRLLYFPLMFAWGVALILAVEGEE